MDFSIIVPFLDRLDALSACLESLAKLRYPRDRVEVILVDDGGRDRAASLVSRFADRLPVRLYRQEHSGPGAARNLGARQARGKWLAFTDSDCMPDDDWLHQLSAVLGSATDLAVGGRVVNTLTNIFSVASQWQTDYVISYFSATSDRPTFFTTNNFAVPRERFLAVGGFDPDFRQAGGEDREFCRRWVREGQRLCWAPEAVVRHEHRLTFGSYFRQHYHYGRGARRYWSLYEQAHKFPPQSRRLYFGLLLGPLRLRPLLRGVAVALLQVASQVATAAGYAVEALSARRGH